MPRTGHLRDLVAHLIVLAAALLVMLVVGSSAAFAQANALRDANGIPYVHQLACDGTPVSTTNPPCGGGGTGGGDASALNQTAVQANAGSDASKAQAVQGITGGKPIPISASALPLPTNASTEATLSNIYTTLGQADGTTCSTDNGSCSVAALIRRNTQRVSALITALGTPLQANGNIGNTAFGISGTLPAFTTPPTVNLGTLNGAALDGSLTTLHNDIATPDYRPSSATITAADTGTSTVAGQNAVSLVTGTPTTNSFQAQAINGMSSGAITVTGTFSGTLQIEGSADGGTTYAPISGLLRGTSSTTASITAPAVVSLEVSDFTSVRVRASAFASGTATVKMAFSPAPGPVKVTNPVTLTEDILAGAQVTPTVTASAYTSGWSVGGLQTIANAARVTGGSGLLQDVQVLIKSTQTAAQAAMDIFLFSDTSLSSTCTNAAAFVLSSSDFAKVVGVIHVTDTTAGNTATMVQALNLAKTYKSAATSLSACAVTRGTPTWATTSDVTFSYNFVRK